MTKRRLPVEPKAFNNSFSCQEHLKNERNKRRREAYAAKKQSSIDQGTEEKLKNERNKRRREAYAAKKQSSIDQGRVSAHRNENVSDCQQKRKFETRILSKEEQRNERNKRRREAYAKKTQSKISGAGIVIVEPMMELNKQNIGMSRFTSVPVHQWGKHQQNNQNEVALKASNSCIGSTIVVDNEKGKTSISGFSIFEIGSTSSTTNSSFTFTGNCSKRSKKSSKCERHCVPTEAAVLPRVKSCHFCNAKKIYLEPDSFCCKNGQVSLFSTSSPPELKMLYTSNSDESKQFRTYIRTYNSSFAFTSFGVKYDKDLCQRNKGIYTFRIQGQVYHFINEIQSTRDKLSHLQLYFYDTDHEMENRMKFSEKLRASIVEKLIQISHLNPYSTFLRSLTNVVDLDSLQIIIKADTGMDQRVYNHPSTSQVAAIWIEDETGTQQKQREIIIQPISGHSEKVQHYFGCYDPLQYPLLFPFGESGWHPGIQRVGKKKNTTCEGQFLVNLNEISSTSDLLQKENQVVKQGMDKKTTVSCREYYCYKLQIRPDDGSVLLCAGRLLQQFCVDMYVKIETSRLQFFRNKQDEIRADLYQGIIDSVSVGEDKASKIGHRIILPPSFIGGPRDLRRRYVDAMALVQRYGKPDIFLTMTCNPSWPEIKAELGPNEEAQNRPDLTSRVFRAKMEQLKDDIIKKGIFGKVAAFVYVIEFQKRGLPHMHLLLILERGHKFFTPEKYDSVVCAEIPDEKENPHLYSMVLKHMMHGPCGEFNPNNVCMKNGKCKNHYPKNFEPITRSSKESYPIYRRRNDNHTVKIRGHVLDNCWVIPYSPYLLAKYDCHINVEICSTVKAVKYLYKYIYKGHDRVGFHVIQQNQLANVDEIEEFQSARWISPPEAMWRIYAFPLNDIYPAVIHLQIHLENQQFVTFKQNADLNSVLKNRTISRTMLTEFFVMNDKNDKAKVGKYLYREFPEHFVWSPRDRMWYERKKGKVIGRIITAHPGQGERYYLRLLLNHIRGPTSFAFLRTVNGKKVKTFREAALLCGLLEEDDDLEQCLQEAASYQMPYSLRRLFATILVHCAPNNPRHLWENFQDFMAEDYTKTTNLSKQEIMRKVLQSINTILQSMGRDIRDFNLCSSKMLSSTKEENCREIEEEINIVVSKSDYESISMLSPEQSIAFKLIIERVFSGNGGCFFIDGPGGTGKTFLYKALLAAVRSKHYIALATASSGVAASILPGGRTAHSRFKIPIDLDSCKSCDIGKQSGLAKLLQIAKLIIWDEASMARRQNIEALNDMLKDVNDSELPFGGKIVVFGGDFRQIPPVVPKGTKYDCIDASFVNSDLWKVVEKITLTENMRAKHDPSFSNYLLRIGNGSEPTDIDGKVHLPSSMVIPMKNPIDGANSIEDLINAVFPDITKYSTDPISMVNSAVLTPKNDCVDEINNILIQKLEGKTWKYTSIDKTIEPNDQGQYEDFINSINPTGLPPHELELKRNCPVMALRNIDPSQGVCNGTRLICRDFKPRVICTEIVVGARKGEIVFIPRIPLQPSDQQKYPVQFTRTQFPIRLCFAMTINKAQGQTLERVGVYLREPVFSHGQLYVALSRATTAAAVKVLIEPTSNDNASHTSTRNVVYKELLELAGCC